MSDEETFNKAVSRWAYRVRSILKNNVPGDGVLSASLKTHTRKNFGEIDRVSYKFARHGVFVQKGVGRGHVMQGGKVVRGVKCKDGSIRYKALYNGKVEKPLTPARVTREPVDWFNTTVEKEVPRLADKIADIKADEVALNTESIKIK